MHTPRAALLALSAATLLACGGDALLAAAATIAGLSLASCASSPHSAVLEPAVLEPAVLEPAVLEPAVLEPAVLEPAASEPAGASRSPSPPAGPGPAAARVQPATPVPQLRGGRMVRIDGGTLLMGSPSGDADERPQHRVLIEPFELDVTEVTAAEYAECVKAGACEGEATVRWDGATPAAVREQSRFCTSGRADRADHPMNCVTWDQARQYCAWAGKRLPTESE